MMDPERIDGSMHDHEDALVSITFISAFRGAPLDQTVHVNQDQCKKIQLHKRGTLCVNKRSRRDAGLDQDTDSANLVYSALDGKNIDVRRDSKKSKFDDAHIHHANQQISEQRHPPGSGFFQHEMFDDAACDAADVLAFGCAHRASVSSDSDASSAAGADGAADGMDCGD